MATSTLEIPLRQRGKAKFVPGKLVFHGDRRFKIDPNEKDPLSPRFDWSKAPEVRGKFYQFPIWKASPKARRFLLEQKNREELVEIALHLMHLMRRKK